MSSLLRRRLSMRLPLEFRRCIVKQNRDPNTVQYFQQFDQGVTVDSKGAAAVGKANPVVVPVETTSVATGLFLNKIDYSMLVYPEFAEIDDLTETDTFAQKVAKLLSDKVDSSEIDKEGAIPDEIRHGLKELGVYGMRIPKEYGGLELNDKQVTRIYEEFSRDWSLMVGLYAHQDLVAYAIRAYGTDEQKQRYLPRLASGESMGAFCLHEETSGNDTAAITTLAAPMVGVENSGRLTLNGTKSWVTNGKEADILIVFGKYSVAHLDEDSKQYLPTTAFIIDRKHHTGIKTLQRRQPVGLRGAEFFDLEFTNVILDEKDVLGAFGRGFNLAMQVIESHRFVFSAAVAAFLKRLLETIAKHCNETKRFGATLSEAVGVQSRIAEITRNTYILETLAYYIAGVRDDDDVGHKHFQLESTMATLFARRALKDAILSAIEIFGASATTTDRELERFLRDSVSLCAFLGSEDLLVSNIALNGLTAWAFTWKDIMHKTKRPLYYPWFLFKNAYFGMNRETNKIQHYIYEHVHPSLENACRNVERSMSKFEYIFRNALTVYGKKVENEHGFLDRVARLSTALFAGIACISRASRSYSIGLNKADFELFLAHEISARLNSEAQHILEELFTNNLGKYEDFNIFDKKVAYQITSAKGYAISSPLDRNCNRYLINRFLVEQLTWKMVNVSKGVLITCDPAMKQFLLYLDEKLELGFRFIIKNLDDDTHLFISPESVTVLQQRIDVLMEKLSPDLAEKM